MMRRFFLLAALILAWGLLLPAAAPAEVVGHLTQVEGRVDILRGGKLPATPARLNAPVESGDVLRSKSLSKAQITLIDHSLITISPGSRLAIDEYVYNPAQKKRRAVLSLFQGLAHVIVHKIFKVEEPDFVIKTYTAITGVRGTDFGVRLAPNSTTILNFEGITLVASNFPELTAQRRRAQSIAYGSKPGGGLFPSGSFVELHEMQGTTVQAHLPPTLPFTITPQDRQQFLQQVTVPPPSRQGTKGGSGVVAGGGVSDSRGHPGGSTSGTVPDSATLGLLTGTGSTAVTLLNTVTVPPTLVSTSTNVTPTPTPSPSTFNFTQQYYGAYFLLSDSPYTEAALSGYSWGSRTGVYDGYFYATTEGTKTAASGTSFASLATGNSNATATGTVTGYLGDTLTGTMTWTSTIAGTTVTRTGTVTILSSGELTFVWTDTSTSSGGTVTSTGTGTTTQTPGTHFTQTVSGQESTTANLAGNQATTTNSGYLTGTRVMEGITKDVKAAFSVTTSSPNAGTFSSSEPHDVTVASEGVLGPADANGVRTGVMTSTSTTSTDTTKSGGPVTYIPAGDGTPDATFATVIGDNAGTNKVQLGMVAVTSDTNATIITQTYEGSGTMTSEPPYTTGTHNSAGWGIGKATTSEGSETTAYTGELTATVTKTSGPPFKPTDTDILQHTGAAVVLPDGSGNYQGPAQGVGVAGDSTVITTTGTTVANSSTQVATTNFSGKWISSDSKGSITSGTLTMTPGTYFQQTTNSTTGSVTLSEPTSTAPYTQTSTLTATMTRTGVSPGTQVLNPAGSVITSTTNTPGALPGAGTVPANINIQGVVNPSGAGYVTVTTHQSAGAPVSTYMGSANINPSTGTLTAPNLVGKNRANPGVNQVPASQTGTVTSTSSP